MQTKTFDAPFAVKAVTEAGAFEGYGSVFDVLDSDRDVIRKGAFKKSLAEKGASRIKMLWQHDPREPIGVYDEVREDDRGLYVQGRLLTDLRRGREAHVLLRHGAVEGLSIGFTIPKGGARADAKNNRRIITEIDLWEVSLVTFPANSRAHVTEAKHIRTERDFERLLRDAGFSRREAKAITAQGFHPDSLRDAGEPELLSVLDDLLSKLKKEDHIHVCRSAQET